MAQQHILVFRFSALGDVAMTVPVVKAVLAQNPDVHISFVSRPAFGGLFEGIERLTFIPVDLNNSYKGAAGLYQLFNFLKNSDNYHALADLHNNLRSRALRILFRLSGLPYQFIDKGRKGKKLLTRFPNKVRVQQQLTTERYADVFRKLGLNVVLHHERIRPEIIRDQDVTAVTGDKTKPWVGVAPFAQHRGKIYPFELMEEVISSLSQHEITIYLFGGTPLEAEICKEWADKYPNVVSLVGRLSIAKQQLLIRQLDVMLSMDSAGMHLASLEGVPVVSIWGATHPYLGFKGFGQSEDDMIFTNIECQPCSTYGQKPCFRKDYACLHGIQPAMVIAKISKYIDDYSFPTIEQ
ncbi:glycosyltransferase family 9 protein [Mucilaginibacter terrenus]|uniref:Glycosyltransferase family 9 protein n=1 Tax=Mucilaginibacter terrenus TaxID=2482727 RepID=A0A3E2NX98_9SPHI|nr:glycosyltransferase family 9 protein [Mucilaginibacter terrenus]RFZ85541.1 glycosyltransferase family 9 protein [Mucilaginibacter terrenus]